ncbi:MAG: putative lipid II flippase FtsW [Methylococcales bacterium]|nr:putative lipid II flippase FtsW [Methylococcales bacterium]
MKKHEKPKPFRFKLHTDPVLVLISFSLLLIGFVMVSSASLHLGAKINNDTLYYPARQFIHMILGLIAATFVAYRPMHFWKEYGGKAFLFSAALLLIVLIPGLGVKVNGSTRWLNIPGFRIQVSEIVKFFTVIFMANYVTKQQKDVQESSTGLLKPLGIFAIVSFLLLLEPDFGSSVVILIIVMGVMFLAGARLLQFLALLSGVGLMAGMLVYFSPYRWQRVTSFMDPWADPLRTGFQLVQALISFGRGEWFGVGLGNGLQKLFYLPEAHTDFLFSVIAEELGLVGVVTIIGLFAAFVWKAFSIGVAAEKMGERFSAFIAYGLGIWFGFQAFVNMGVNMGLLPTKGLTLPLMSYGGGSMMIMCCAVALLFRIHHEVTEYNANLPKGYWHD